MSEHPNFTESCDAKDWAEAFVAHVQANPSIATDEGTMIGWFANAIMRGYDEHARIHPTLRETLEATEAYQHTLRDAEEQRAKRVQAEQDAAALRAQLADAIAVIGSSKPKVALHRTRQERDALRTERDALTTENRILESQVEHFQAERDALSARLETERLRAEALQGSIDGCAQRVSELRAKLEAQTYAIRALVQHWREGTLPLGGPTRFGCADALAAILSAEAPATPVEREAEWRRGFTHVQHDCKPEATGRFCVDCGKVLAPPSASGETTS